MSLLDHIAAHQRRDLPRLRRYAPVRPRPSPRGPRDGGGRRRGKLALGDAGGVQVPVPGERGVLAALTVALVGLSFTGGGIWTLILVLSDEAFGLGTEGSGFLNSVYGVGGVVGGLAAGYLASKVRLGPAVIWSIGAGSVVFICLGISPAGVLPFVIMFVVGILDIMVEVNSTTIIQTGTPEELLGRVFGAFDGVLILAMLAGALIVGPLIDLLGPRTTTVVSMLVALGIFLLCLPRLRKLDRVLLG
ncbi:MAG TPA: MFS transporter [Rubrobacter sp.]|nr:MFS transporter [Rubrobacter sp.]